MHAVYLPSKIFMLLLIIPCRKATNSAGPGTRQCATDSVQHVDQIRTQYESNDWLLKPGMLAVSAVHIYVIVILWL